MPYSIMLDAGHGGYPLRKYLTDNDLSDHFSRPAYESWCGIRVCKADSIRIRIPTAQKQFVESFYTCSVAHT